MKSFIIETLNVFLQKVMRPLYFGRCQNFTSIVNLATETLLKFSNEHAEKYIQSCIYRKIVSKMLLNYQGNILK